VDEPIILIHRSSSSHGTTAESLEAFGLTVPHGCNSLTIAQFFGLFAVSDLLSAIQGLQKSVIDSSDALGGTGWQKVRQTVLPSSSFRLRARMNLFSMLLETIQVHRQVNNFMGYMKIQRAEEEEFEKLFNRYDLDNTGWLEYDTVHKMLTDCSEQPEAVVTCFIQRCFALKPHNHLSCSSFCQLMGAWDKKHKVNLDRKKRPLSTTLGTMVHHLTAVS
jgi:hypothetical protein